MNYSLLNYTRMAFLLIHSNLQDRWQRVKINTTFSSWTQLLQGVLQGSVFGPILFNIFINDIFFALKGIDMCYFSYPVRLQFKRKTSTSDVKEQF